MENVSMAIQGSELVIRVDLTKRMGPSRSGKTMIIGTTGGNVKVQNECSAAPEALVDGVVVGLNVYVGA
jgi:ABC-type uncharacterized transport system YnjBCD ATPase subunit